MPELLHPIVEQLYEIDCFIDADVLTEILDLGEAVIPDLESILRDFIDRGKCESDADGWDFAHLHAFYLLAELRAEHGLPTVLEFLAQDEEFLDSWLSDMLTEDLWEIVCKCGASSLGDLEQFLLSPDHFLFARTAVLTAVSQIGLHFPEKRDEAVRVFAHVFYRYSSGKIGEPVPGQNVFEHHYDPEFLTWTISAASHLGATELAEDVRSAFKEEMVNLWILDDPADFGEVRKRHFLTIFEKYDSIKRHYAFARESPHNPKRRKRKQGSKSRSTDSTLRNLSAKPGVSVNVTAKDRSLQVKKTYTFGEEGLPLEELGSFAQAVRSDGTGHDPEACPEPAPRTKVGRNAPCPCGSGKKHKKCCGR